MRMLVVLRRCRAARPCLSVPAPAWTSAHHHPARISHRLFRSLGVRDDLAHRLHACGLRVPTAAQRLAIPPMLAGRDVVLAAETGGGKTLAYAVPLLQRLQMRDPPPEQPMPIAAILTASADLVAQVARVLAQLAPQIAASSISVAMPHQPAMSKPRAVLIATPRALLQVLKPREYAQLELLVVDEADMLLSGGFERDVKQILATMRNRAYRQQAASGQRSDRHAASSSSSPCQVIFSAISFLDGFLPRRIGWMIWMADGRLGGLLDYGGLCALLVVSCLLLLFVYATIPSYGTRSPRQFLQHYYPDAVIATTEDFHRTLPQLELVTHDLDAFILQQERASSALASSHEEQHRMDLLWSILQAEAQVDQDADHDQHAHGGDTLIFASSIESATALHRDLTISRGIACELFHKNVTIEERQRIRNLLSAPHETVAAAVDQKQAERRSPMVVVATDLAARGLDTIRVQHVIQYEFATDVVSYLHRLGRTARAGSRGKVSSIVSKQNELVLSKIREAGGASLHGAFSRKRSLRKKAKTNRNRLGSIAQN